jgi:DNA polymerase/3'-5' exonuclease PolX
MTEVDPVKHRDRLTVQEIADFLEIKGENPFRVRAYRRAAQRHGG